jgi:hypothetical protein
VYDSECQYAFGNFTIVWAAVCRSTVWLLQVKILTELVNRAVNDGIGAKMSPSHHVLSLEDRAAADVAGALRSAAMGVGHSKTR